MANVIETIKNRVSIDPQVMSAPRSISSVASKSTYFFPVIVSKSVGPDALSLSVSSLEYAYCGFVTACFELQPAIKVKGDVLNIEEYLKRFHQNIGIKSSNELFMSLGTNLEDAQEYKMFVNDVLNEEGSVQTQSKTNFDMSQTVKEAEKRNGLMATPVTVPVTFIFNDKLIEKKVTVGVKATAHTVPADDIVSQLSNSLQNRGIFHNLVKYFSGEMLSLKDILFGVSDMKNSISGKSELAKWIGIIRHRKNLNKISMGLLAKKPYLPNVSIVLAMTDVYDIEHLSGINLLKDPADAAKFIKNNFLLNITVVDEASNTLYTMYDGYTKFEEYPFATIQRENKKSAADVSELIRAISRAAVNN